MNHAVMNLIMRNPRPQRLRARVKPRTVGLRGGERLESRILLTGDTTGTKGPFTWTRSPSGVEITSVAAISVPYLQVPSTIEGYDVTSIAPFAFADYRGSIVSIPETVREIGWGAFTRWGGNCQLTWVDVSPANPVFAGHDGAVYDKAMSRLVAVPGGRASTLTVPAGVSVIDDQAFFECTLLPLVELPEGLTSIEARAFSGCLSLISVTFPDSLTTLGYEAFAWCRTLANISIPAGVTFVDDRAFLGCTGLHSIDVADDNPVYQDVGGLLLDGSGSRLMVCPPARQGAVTVPAGVTVIGANSFTLNPDITEVTLPESVRSIERMAFSASYQLERLNFLGPPPDLGKQPVWPGEVFNTGVTRGFRLVTAPGWDALEWNLDRPLDVPEVFGGMTMMAVTWESMDEHLDGLNHAPIDLFCSGTVVEELQPIGTVVGELAATDPDLGIGDTLTFAVVDPFVPFTVRDRSLVTTYPLDFESTPRFFVRVRATDSRGLATERVLPITVTDVDETPRILAVSWPEARAYRAGDVLSFTVTGNQPIFVTGKPVLDLRAGKALRSAVYASGSGTTELVFTYRVKKTDGTVSALTLGDSIRLPSRQDRLRGASGEAVVRRVPAGVVPGVTIDTSAPRIVDVTPPVVGTYAPGDALRFIVTFGEIVSVGGIPKIRLSLDRNGAATASYVSGSGGRTLVFEYVVQSGDSAIRGPKPATAISLNGGAIRDAAGNPADLRLRAPKFKGVVVTSGGGALKA